MGYVDYNYTKKHRRDTIQMAESEQNLSILKQLSLITLSWSVNILRQRFIHNLSFVFFIANSKLKKLQFLHLALFSLLAGNMNNKINNHRLSIMRYMMFTRSSSH